MMFFSVWFFSSGTFSPVVSDNYVAVSGARDNLMLFEDIDCLNDFIRLIRNDPQPLGKTAGRFRDLQDAEVDKLYGSSPPETDLAGTFELESPMLENEKENLVEQQTTEKDSKTDYENNPILSARKKTDELFQYREIQFSQSENSAAPSGLSLLLSNNSNQKGKGMGNAPQLSGMPIKVYLPNREPMTVHVSPTNTVEEIIKLTLTTHQHQGIATPKLYYHAPEYYELRLHEGDGEPDEDFPALDRHRTLKQFGNVSECCLCVKKGATPPPLPSTASAVPVTPTKDILPLNMLMIQLPNVGHVKLRLEPTTTSRDLLPQIAKKHRIRLYTEDYIFTVSIEDQTRLKLSTRVIDLDLPLLEMGIQELELHKKVYADDPKAKINASRSLGVDLDRISTSDMSMMYTDVTAAVYQEWNIIKKNKFGRMQPRVIGVDGQKIYNSKRDNGNRNSSSVSRAQRDLTSVRKVEILDDDSRAFRITFKEDEELFDIDYYCESARESAEIVAKISFLVSKKQQENN